MTGRTIAAVSLVCAVAVGLALWARTATPATNGVRKAEVCGKSADVLGEALDWGEFSREDAANMSLKDTGGVRSSDSSVDANIEFLVGATDYVVQVEVVDVGQIRFNTPTGRHTSVADRSSGPDSYRAYAPVMVASRNYLKPADVAGQPCGFIIPVRLPQGVQDKATVSTLASRLTSGLQGVAFLNSVVSEEALPWLSYLELNRNRLANRLREDGPIALVGAFFPIDGKNVIGYRGGAVPIDQFNALVAEAAASRK